MRAAEPETPYEQMRGRRVEAWLKGVAKLEVLSDSGTSEDAVQRAASADLARLLPAPEREGRPLIDLLREMLEHLPDDKLDEYTRRLEDLEAESCG